MQYRNAMLVSVDIRLAPFDEAVELIAHELEHVIEQLDGIDLEVHARAGTAWKKEDGSFETRRAIEVGRRVAQDVSQPGARTEPLAVQQHASWRPFGVVAQHDPFASVQDPPSGRVLPYVSSPGCSRRRDKRAAESGCQKDAVKAEHGEALPSSADGS
ncbi:MAG TPA: hypothetical protein VGQ77_16830 [Methylomirabilota bacterium]|jgi:hypothetical protein|nr:hypothetical protein [Methylomirabilota bacterium]